MYPSRCRISAIRIATVVLPGSGVAGKAHVQRRRLGVETDMRAQPVDDQQCGDLADARLDRNETDQLVIEPRRERSRTPDSSKTARTSTVRSPSGSGADCV